MENKLDTEFLKGTEGSDSLKLKYIEEFYKDKKNSLELEHSKNIFYYKFWFIAIVVVIGVYATFSQFSESKDLPNPNIEKIEKKK